MALRRRRATAAEFILRHAELEPAEIVHLGRTAGFEITPKLVEAVRFFWSRWPVPVRKPRATQLDAAPQSEPRPSAKIERRFVQLAQEIGLSRAAELLDLVEQLLREEQAAEDPGRDAG
jgi:hypothetical protein